MADIKFGAKDYSGIKKLNFPLSDGSGYAQFSLGGSETAEYSWNQIPELVRNFLDNVTYDPSDYTTSRIAEFAPATADLNNTYPIGKTIETETGVLDRNGYEMAVQNGNTVLYNDIPNQYTEYVVRNGGAVSQAGTLKPTGALRQIKCVTKNVRDLGGWACDGGTIKYGKLFRGGAINANDVDIFINQLGIRHELDLRGTDEAESDENVLRDYIGYTCPKLYVWYTITDAYKETWKEILKCVFDAVKSNKPLYFHCSAGADRTGTVACILNAILGVSQSDLDKDYELTCFYTGTGTDNSARRRNEAEWKGLITQINALTVGDTFRDKVLNWVASLGFTVDEINDFRAAMIDGTPDTIVLSIGTQTITNTLTNVENSNTDASIAKYQPYEAKITAPEGYAIESITVTMGGKDITKEVFDGKPTNLFRSIAKNLANCALDNVRKAVIDGQGYVANVVVNDGYTLEGGTVALTMGGIDIMANYYSEGKIAIPNVTGDIVITVQAVESATPVTVIPIVWNDGYYCSYTLGTDFGLIADAGYITSDVIQVQAGTQYYFNIKSAGVTNTSMKVVGADSNGKVTEAIALSNIYSDNSYPFTVKDGTTQIRMRGYADTGFKGTSTEDTISYE